VGRAVATRRDARTARAEASASGEPTQGPAPGFEVSLDVFSGPFEVLLSLIAKKSLDITEVSLATVTDEFVGYIKARSPEWDLDITSQFLVIASTLLDLKAARLLPAGEVEDADDLAMLEARDLLFARLLQYRAYREAAVVLADWMATEAERYPRAVSLEEPFAQLLPEVVMAVGPTDMAALAATAMAPKPVPVISLEHVHSPAVSVREQAAIVVDRLRGAGVASFRSLTADCPTRHHVVARFLGLLELFRAGQVSFEQVTPLGDLSVRWRGDGDGEVDLNDEFDEPAEADDAAEAADADEADRTEPEEEQT
jgi:segregation and condensation protein A